MGDRTFDLNQDLLDWAIIGNHVEDLLDEPTPEAAGTAELAEPAADDER